MLILLSLQLKVGHDDAVIALRGFEFVRFIPKPEQVRNQYGRFEAFVDVDGTVGMLDLVDRLRKTGVGVAVQGHQTTEAYVQMYAEEVPN